jgi:hypothetical protein
MLRRALPLLALLAVACAPDRTAILVEVTSSDLAAPDDVDALRFAAVSEYGGRIDRSFPISSTWPQSLTIVPPEAERMGRITITVTGTHGADFVVRRVVEAAFEPGTTRRVSVDLSAACRGVMCADGVDCRAGSCVGVSGDAGVDGGADGGTIPEDAGDDAQVVTEDAGADASAGDAGTDGGPLDGGPRDGGPLDAGTVDAGSVFRCVDEACIGRVLISEVAPRSATSASDEFVELYNPGTVPIDVGGVALRYVSMSGASESGRGAIASGTIIAPHGYLLLVSSGYTGMPAGDGVVPAWTTGLADSGSVLLRTPTSHDVDIFGWGGSMRSETTSFATAASASAPSFERKARATSTEMTMSVGGADALAGNAYDSGNNASDFVSRGARDPQSAASPTEP